MALLKRHNREHCTSLTANPTLSLRVITDVIYLLPLLLLAFVPALAQSGDCSKPFTAQLASGGHVNMTLRAGDIEIVGTKQDVVRVTCRLDRGEDGPNIKINFAASHLRVYGGPNKGVHYRIEVPEKTGLNLKASAGNLDVKGITGDKEVELNAGNLTMEVGDPSAYKVAEGKVMAGDLNARPFGAQTGGLGRSFRKESSNGKYRLRAELMAGDLTLK